MKRRNKLSYDLLLSPNPQVKLLMQFPTIHLGGKEKKQASLVYCPSSTFHSFQELSLPGDRHDRPGDKV